MKLLGWTIFAFALFRDATIDRVPPPAAPFVVRPPSVRVDRFAGPKLDENGNPRRGRWVRQPTCGSGESEPYRWIDD